MFSLIFIDIEGYIWKSLKFRRSRQKNHVRVSEVPSHLPLIFIACWNPFLLEDYLLLVMLKSKLFKSFVRNLYETFTGWCFEPSVSLELIKSAIYSVILDRCLKLGSQHIFNYLKISKVFISPSDMERKKYLYHPQIWKEKSICITLRYGKKISKVSISPSDMESKKNLCFFFFFFCNSFFLLTKLRLSWTNLFNQNNSFIVAKKVVNFFFSLLNSLSRLTFTVIAIWDDSFSFLIYKVDSGL